MWNFRLALLWSCMWNAASSRKNKKYFIFLFWDVVTWSRLKSAGYAQHGCGKEALSCFQHIWMKACFLMQSPNVLEPSRYMALRMVLAWVRESRIYPTWWWHVSWNGLIVEYAQHGFGKEAEGYFQQLRSDWSVSRCIHLCLHIEDTCFFNVLFPDPFAREDDVASLIFHTTTKR